VRSAFAPRLRDAEPAPAMPTTGTPICGTRRRGARSCALACPSVFRWPDAVALFVAGALRPVARCPASTMARLADRRPLGADYVASTIASACEPGARKRAPARAPRRMFNDRGVRSRPRFVSPRKSLLRSVRPVRPVCRCNPLTIRDPDNSAGVAIIFNQLVITAISS
jgi:hypothetical protein